MGYNGKKRIEIVEVDHAINNKNINRAYALLFDQDDNCKREKDIKKEEAANNEILLSVIDFLLLESGNKFEFYENKLIEIMKEMAKDLDIEIYIADERVDN